MVVNWASTKVAKKAVLSVDWTALQKAESTAVTKAVPSAETTAA